MNSGTGAPGKPRKVAEPRRGTEVFRPRARIIRTLGKDLIQNQFVAIQELVKNSYDADAHAVTLTFEGPLGRGEGSLTIADDGEGMSLDVVRGSWMEPATIRKRRQKTTPGGRRVTGEKGIGRFAAARVARSLELDSVTAASHERVVATFNWSEFDNEDSYLDEIRCEWEVSPGPEDRLHGTILRLSRFNEGWDAASLGRLRIELARLLPPTGPIEDFSVSLSVPSPLDRFSGPITPPRVLEFPRFRMGGSVNGDGTIDATIAFAGEVVQVVGPKGKPDSVVIDREGVARPPTCGPFTFEFLVWDRDKDTMEELANAVDSTLENVREDLDSIAGIQIYRDKFRVALQDQDWLGLEARRVDAPTMHLGNNQIVGRVSIDSDQNPGLVDQSNRQALVASPELDDLQDSIEQLLTKLETFRYQRKRQRPKASKPSGILKKLDLSPIRDYVAGTDLAEDEGLAKVLERKEKDYHEALTFVQDTLSRYRRLATLGTLIDVLLHEGRTPIGAIANAAEQLEHDLGPGAEGGMSKSRLRSVRTIQEQSHLLSRLFDRLSPFSGAGRGRREQVEIEDILQRSLEIHKRQFERETVQIELPETHTRVSVDPADLELLFNNLLENALYWLQRVPPDKRQIVVKVRRNPESVEVLFSDSGPGVPPENVDLIWEPYFTTKARGIGLGLTIAGETADAHGGDLELVSEGPLPGATFRLVLPNSVES